MQTQKNIQDRQTAEWRALVYFCHLGIRGEIYDNGYQFDPEDIDWLRLKRLSGMHGVRPLLSHGMSLWKDKEYIPREIFDELAGMRKQRSLINMDHAREMVRLIRLLAQRGVELIPYKGVVLGQEAYGDMGLREMSDIDLLMELDKFEEIREILLGRNYVPSKNVPKDFETIFFKQNFEYNFDLYEGEHRKYHVEPHWKIGFRRWQTDLTYSDIYPFTQKRSFFGTELNMLTPEGLLLTTSLHHGGEDRWNQLKYVCDIAAILFTCQKELNWDLLLQESERFKVRNIVLLGVCLAVKIFDAPVPDQVIKLTSKRKIQKLSQRVLEDLWQGMHSANLNTYFKDISFHFSLRQHLSTRFKVLYYHLTQVFTPTIYDINDEKSQGKKYRWLFLTRPFRIWRTHVRNDS